MKRTLGSLLVLTLTLCLLVGGASATWLLTDGRTTPSEILANFRFAAWSGAEELPDDELIGESHISLIEQIINHPQHGLNKSGSYLNEQISARKKGGLGWSGRDTLGSMAVTQTDELTDIFGLASYNLNFLIQFKSDTEYFIFTTSVELGQRGEINILGYNKTPGKPTTPIGSPIYPIYRTRVVKQGGVWTAVETKEGYCSSDWYDESRRNANATQIPSFDPNTFMEGSPS